MLSATQLPEHLDQISKDHPDIQFQVTITVDPLLLDEYQREVKAFPIVRSMEAMRFKSEPEAQRHLQNLTLQTYAGEQLSTTAEERQADEARNLMAKAFQSTDKDERIALATAALALRPECTEAYILIAEKEDDAIERIRLLERGLEVASAQIRANHEDLDVVYWQKLETRSYMRCRFALASAIWKTGDKQNAIDHLKALLELNPYDNQGIRYHLLNWLLDRECSDSTLDEHFKTYETEESAFGKYAFALRNSVRFGSNRSALKALNDAIEANKFVPLFLCGAALVPDFRVKRVVRGTVPEAVAYYGLASSIWQGRDGAVTWLRENCSSLLQSKTILRKIRSAEEYRSDAPWAGPMPMQLTIANRTLWR